MGATAHHWWQESSELLTTPDGVRGRQLTSAPRITHNIYCEQPYTTPDGNRILLFRTDDPDWAMPGELLLYDIPTYRLTRLERIVGGAGGVLIWQIANAAYSGIIFVLAQREGKTHLVRWNLNTVESEVLFPWGENVASLATVSADHSFGLTSGRLPDGDFAIYRISLLNGEKQLIHENPFINNPHLQLRLHNAQRTLVQENRGAIVDESGNIIRNNDDRGIGLYSIAVDGCDRRDFPVGPPHTASTTGHASWVGDSDRVIVSLAEPYFDGERTGNMVEVSHNWSKPRVVFESPQIWYHVSISRCGRYLVTDTGGIPGMPILVANIATGKNRILFNAETTAGGGQYSHAHAYLTADNKWVVYTSDRTGISQAYIASVPDGFLESLD